MYQAMAAEKSLEYMPAASLKRLRAKLDGCARGRRHPSQSAAICGPVERPGRRWSAMAAADGGVDRRGGGGSQLADENQWVQFRARELPPDYHTVTTSQTRAPDEVIRAVFSPSITLVELQAILDEAQLRIISGPTEAGVYSLARNSDGR